MKTLAITAARGGSKGIPRKNLIVVSGKPLIAWTLLMVRRCTLVDRHVVLTDDDEIADVAELYGAEVVRDRHAGDRVPDKSILREALVYCLNECEKDGHKYDIVADIRCTNPLTEPEDVDGAIKKLVDTNADVVCGVTQLHDHHPARIKQVFHDRLIDFAWPEPSSGLRQDLKPDAYIRNGSLYIVRAGALRNGIHFQGSDEIRPWYMPEERSANLDTKIDLYRAEALLRERNK